MAMHDYKLEKWEDFVNNLSGTRIRWWKNNQIEMCAGILYQNDINKGLLDYDDNKYKYCKSEISNA